MTMRRPICLALFLLAAVPAGAGVADLADMVKASGVRGGIVVHLGCGDGRRMAALRLGDRYLVHGLDASDANVREARRNIRAAGLCGLVSACKFDGGRLPYVDNLVNLIVSDGPTGVPGDEIMRVLAPSGVAFVDGRRTVKPRPTEIDEWTHYLHGPDNNAVADDSVVATPRSIQWVSGPRWGRSHEELASMSAAVSAKGRVFFIVDEARLSSIRFMGKWKLVARDAFNGMLLWKKDVPGWNDHLRHFRSGPVHLPRRLVAAGDTVYVTLGLAAPVTALDAATGETVRVYEGTGHTEEILLADGVLYLAVGTSEAERRGGGLFKRGEPEPTGFRHVAAVDAGTGRQLWRKAFGADEYLLPLTLAVSGGGLFYQSTFGVVRLDARSGRELWRTRRRTVTKRMGWSAPTLVATDGVVLSADREPAGKDGGLAVAGKVEWGVHGWNEAGFARKGKSTVRAYSAETGKELWSAPASEGYNSPVDVFVIAGTAWIGSNFKGYDLRTGEPGEELSWRGDRVGMGHHRCYRDKATAGYILTGRSGVEVVSLAEGWLNNNSWIRGTCQYGIMPANGLIYAPPDACACFPKAKVAGFFAAAPKRGGEGRMPSPPGRGVAEERPLEKGPAYGWASSAKVARDDGDAADAEAWPTYRHDGERSGAASTSVPASPARLWSASIGGRLTQPVVARGRVYVASVDTHTVHAMSVDGGGELWTYTAGGRVDSPPTVHGGTVLFGSADGWVYCLRATDGDLAWRFRAAPRERLVGAFDQLESVWPVHGAVLVQSDTVYAAAGRSTYLDGGIVLYRLDPVSGKELSRTVLHDIDPRTDRQLAGEGRNDMQGSTSDVLTGDGESVFLKHLHIDRSGKRTDEERPHLFAITGFLGEEWFVRSYWLIGTDVGAGWGGWANAARKVPAGRIMCFDAEHIYAYGRTAVAGGATGHRMDAYHLSAKKKVLVSTRPAPRGPKVKGKKGARGKRERPPPPPPPVWSDDRSLIVRAMVLASDRLVIAGPPDLARKDPKLLAYTNEDEAVSGFGGGKGVFLRVLSAADGEKRSEQRLTSMPVFDGMSAASGRIYLALKDGTVECWGGR